MDSWSKTNKNSADAELLHCILIVKGDASQILKKVSIIRFSAIQNHDTSYLVTPLSIALSYMIHLTSNFYRFN